MARHSLYRGANSDREERLQQLLLRYVELTGDAVWGGVGEGWHPILGEAALSLDAVVPGWSVAQFKEKFGGLRFYINLPEGTSRELAYAAHAIASEAERKAYGICEFCGDYGKLRDEGWAKTLCDFDARRYYEEGYRPWRDEA